MRAICGKNAVVFLTTDYTEHTDFKVKVTATALFEAGEADSIWRCQVKVGRGYMLGWSYKWAGELVGCTGH